MPEPSAVFELGTMQAVQDCPVQSAQPCMQLVLAGNLNASMWNQAALRMTCQMPVAGGGCLDCCDLGLGCNKLCVACGRAHSFF